MQTSSSHLTKKKNILILFVLSLLVIGVGLTLFLKTKSNPEEEKSIKDLQELKMPQIAPGGELVYKSPTWAKSVEIRHSGNEWSLGKKLRQNLLDKITKTWRIPISELGYKPGRHRFKFVIDGDFEQGYDRVLYVDDSRGWVRPENTQPKIEYLTETSGVLRIKDDSATFIEIIGLGSDWKTRVPLTFNDNNKLWELKDLNLEKGRYTFKVVKDGVLEGGADRVITVNSRGLIDAPSPRYARIREMQHPSKTMIVDSPGTTFLALKGSFDNWNAEFPLKPRDVGFSIDIGELNLAKGMYEVKFINSDGFEPTSNHPIYINERGEIYFPNFDDINVVTNQPPSTILQARRPDLVSLSVCLSEDNWQKFYPMEMKDGVWEVNLEGLKKGKHNFKFLPNGKWESRDNRELIIGPDSKIYFPKNVSIRIISLSANKLKVQAPNFVTLGIKTSKDWGEELLATYNEKESLWEVNLQELNISRSDTGRHFFKFTIDGEFEDGPNRTLIVDEEGKFSIGRLAQPKNIDPEVNNFVKTNNEVFGEIRKISPNKQLSLKGDDQWISDMRIYHLWVPSFRDSTKGQWSRDKIGDLRGVREAIAANYFEPLAINAIWLSPIFSAKGEGNPTEMMHGYDVLDDYRVNVNFGDLQEFQSLLRDAHSKGIRIILDVIPNHVSDEHPWFIASKDPKHPEHEKYKDFFIWKDKPDESWNKTKFWGNSSITYSPERKQYYYGLFGGSLPDLNYNNPEVRRHLINNIIYWLNMGVDGIKFDAIGHTYEGTPGKEAPDMNHPENIKFYQDIFDILKEYEKEGFTKLVLAENYTWKLNEVELYGTQNGRTAAQSTINFAFAESLQKSIRENSPIPIKDHLLKEQAKNILYTRFVSNHDGGYSRPVTDYGVQGAKLAGAINIVNPGPYLLYYGEEIGTEGRNNNNENLRKPYSWVDYKKQLKDPNSILSFYKTLSSLRTRFKENLKWENMIGLNANPINNSDKTEDVSDQKNPLLPLLYKGKDKHLLAVYNFSNRKRNGSIQMPTGNNFIPNREYNIVKILSTGSQIPSSDSSDSKGSSDSSDTGGLSQNTGGDNNLPSVSIPQTWNPKNALQLRDLAPYEVLFLELSSKLD